VTNTSTPPQPMCPHGVAGRAFARIMERLNAPIYALALDHLDLRAGNALLEIGFGTGRFLELALRRVQPLRLVGLDPSELMCEFAHRRLRRYQSDNEIELLRGDDRDVPGAGRFDHVVAIHSFQFWRDPGASLRGIHHTLAPGGSVLLALRKHGAEPPAWLPNPISRAGDEVAEIDRTVQAIGFSSLSIAADTRHSVVCRFDRQGF